MSGPLHSMHIIGSWQFGGAERFFLRLVEALHQSGDRVTAVYRGKSRVRQALAGQIERIELPMFNNIWDFYSPLKIRALVKQRRPDIVQTYMGRASHMTRIGRGWKSLHVARLGGFYKVRGYYEHADAWVANSRELYEYLAAQGLPRERLYRIGNFVAIEPPTAAADLAALRRRSGIPAEALIIFSLGRLIEIKGFADLLEAFSRLPRTIGGRPLWLMLAGAGPLRKPLLHRAEQLSITDRVCWPGWQDQPGPLFDLADLFVCPSIRETLGNVILEAWAHRLPVVATATSGARELIRDGVNGLLCPRRDPAALAERCSLLLREGAATRENLAAAGMTSLISAHSQPAVVAAYRDMYWELIRKYR